MEDQKHAENPEPSGEVTFCRLCAKNKPADEFEIIILSRLGNALIKYAACRACGTVIHNATVIVKETVEKFIADQPKILTPPGGITGPRG